MQNQKKQKKVFSENKSFELIKLLGLVKTKKILSAFVALTIILLLFSCGEETPTENETAKETKPQEPQTPTKGWECVAALEGTQLAVRKLSFSPDGRLLAFADSSSGLIRLWTIEGREELVSLEGHTDLVDSLAFSPDNKLLASGSEDHTIKLWSIESRGCVATLEGHRGDVESVAFSPDGKLLVSGSDWLNRIMDDLVGEIKLWDVESRECIATITTLERHKIGVRSLALSPDGEILASGDTHNTITLWDVETRQKLTTLKADPDWLNINSAVFSPDGRLLATRDTNDMIRLWDMQIRECVATFQGRYHLTGDPAFSPDSSLLASAFNNNEKAGVKLWDVESTECVATINEYPAVWWPTNYIAFSSTGLLAATCNDRRNRDPGQNAELITVWRQRIHGD